MTGPYLRLTQHGSNLAVYVNAAAITHFAETSGKDGCHVHLVGGSTIHTEEPAGAIMDMIDNLMMSDSARIRPAEHPTLEEALVQQSGPFRPQT
jgi:hypothetical protein